MNARGTARKGRPALLWQDERLRIGLAVLLAAVLVWRLAGDEVVAPTATLVPPSAPALDHYDDLRIGLTLRHPPSWVATTGARVVRLRSPDGAVAVAIASPTAGRLPARVLRDTERALLGAYAPARVVRRARGRVGVVPAGVAQIAGILEGRPVRVLAIAAASRYRTYAVQVVSRLPPAPARLAEAQRILDSVRFGRPSALPS